MTTIAYDLPVKDLIAGLDATGHVTHEQYRKTHVTLHHNGGRLSHEGVLSVWQTRPASAHFDVDSSGAIAQYVRVNEYAWACGNTDGNVRSISIEMCNLTLGPDWQVAEVTWRSAARLAGWLFARVIGTRPTRETLVRHKYWNPTECAGPYTDKVYDKILAVAQETFDAIVRGATPKQEDKMVYVAKGDAAGEPGYAHYLVEVNGQGASKMWLKTDQLVKLFLELLEQPEVKVRKQWTLDFITTIGELG